MWKASATSIVVQCHMPLVPIYKIYISSDYIRPPFTNSDSTQLKYD